MSLNPQNLRQYELLADRALGELTQADEAELNALLPNVDLADRDSMDRVATAVELSTLTGTGEPMPESLRARLRLDATRFLSEMNAQKVAEKPVQPIAATSLQPIRPSSSRRWLLGSFLAVAASIAILLLTPLNPFTPRGGSAPTRDTIVHSPDAIIATWQPGPDPIGQHVHGDVAWSNAKQAGYLRFSGLAKNDAAHEQYQLWIFDANQDPRYPIDGGVFNIDRTTGDVIIPITPKLHVVQPTMFAISIEKSGGVVVSDRKHLPLIAKVS